MIRYTVYYSGRVQGVGFRYTACQIAANHEVCGYVQNLDDGRVLLVVEGQETNLKAFLDDLSAALGRYIHDHTLARSPATGEFGQPGLDALTIRY